MRLTVALCLLVAFAASAAGFGAAESSLALHRLGSLSPVIEDHVLRRDGTGRYFVSTGVEGLPSAAAWEVLPNEECAILRSVPSVKAPVVPAKDRSLPPSCATELEGVCTSRDGRLRVFTYFEGTYKARKVRSGFTAARIRWRTNSIRGAGSSGSRTWRRASARFLSSGSSDRGDTARQADG